MSVKASNWVWHQLPDDDRIKHGHLVVLLALADISDDDGNCTFGDPDKRKQPALAAKTRMSQSTFRRVIRRLEELDLIGIDIRGLMNVYRLNLGWPAPLELSTAHSDRWRTAREKAEFDRWHRSTVTGQGNVIHEDLNQSVPDATTGGSVQSDDSIHRPSPARMPAHPQVVDWPALTDKLPMVFLTIEPIVLEAMGREILSRAASRVLNATHYVGVALERDPFEWSKWAFEHEGDRRAKGGEW